MSRACPSCGADAARTRFCTSCGQPLPSGRRNPWSTVVLAAVAVVVVAVVGVVLLQTAGSADSEPAVVAVVPESSPAASVAPSTSGLSRATGAPSASAPSARSAASELSAIKSADAMAVGRLQGYWVSQVSAKREGLVADGRVYDEAAILAEHLRLARAYPGVVLFESDRFASYSSSGFWISVVAVPYSTADEANAWCDAADLPADACYAKRLVQSPSGRSTVPR